MQAGCGQDSSGPESDHILDLAIVCTSTAMTIVSNRHDFPLTQFIRDLEELGISVDVKGVAPCG